MFLSEQINFNLIVGIVFCNIFVYKVFGIQHESFTIATKFVIGMCLACLTMCIAGTVEKFRQDKCNSFHNIEQYSHLNRTILLFLGQQQNNLSIFYQLPQNILMGLSEVFAMLASFEYAYFAAPRSGQTLFMSLRFCSLGISSYLANVYFAIFSHLPSKLDFTVSMASAYFASTSRFMHCIVRK